MSWTVVHFLTVLGIKMTRGLVSIEPLPGLATTVFSASSLGDLEEHASEECVVQDHSPSRTDTVLGSSAVSTRKRSSQLGLLTVHSQNGEAGSRHSCFLQLVCGSALTAHSLREGGGSTHAVCGKSEFLLGKDSMKLL